MNAHRAQREARRRWGPDAFVLQDRFGECRVGVKRAHQFHVAGIGPSFPEAFADADATEARHVEEEARAV